ncbi:hypothetical protein Hanom_Chr07g00581341 [Helianthus anomalus]
MLVGVCQSLRLRRLLVSVCQNTTINRCRRCKRSAVCGPHLQMSARVEVDQMSVECNKKSV